MPDLYGARRELKLRVKLIFGLFLLGGFLGGLLRAAYLAEWPGDWGLYQWFLWFKWLLTHEWGGDLALHAGIGSAVLGLPALWLLIRPRRTRKPYSNF